MRHVTSVSVACGGHAGDAGSMERCILLAKRLGVGIGAHPGIAGEFGREEAKLSPREFELLLLHQLGGFHRLTQVHRIRLHHVKLHGALYHAVEANPALAEIYLAVVGNWFAGLPIYALAGGRVATTAPLLGLAIRQEFFADRAYRADGTLVARPEPGAVISSPAAIFRRVQRLQLDGGVETIDGNWVSLNAQTICVHSDSPNSIRLVQAAARALRR
jgi:UPF0271 protein